MGVLLGLMIWWDGDRVSRLAWIVRKPDGDLGARSAEVDAGGDLDFAGCGACGGAGRRARGSSGW